MARIMDLKGLRVRSMVQSNTIMDILENVDSHQQGHRGAQGASHGHKGAAEAGKVLSIDGKGLNGACMSLQ